MKNQNSETTSQNGKQSNESTNAVMKPSQLMDLFEDGHFNCNDVILSTNYTYGLNFIGNKEPQGNLDNL